MNGSIRRRGKESWELTIDLGFDAGGKRKRKFVTVRGKRVDADRRLREVMAAHDKGLPLDTGKITLGQWLMQWHRDYAEAHTRPRTAERYMGDIRNHLVPAFGSITLPKITPRDVQAMEANLLAKGLSPRSVQHAHRVLSEAFKHAVQMGLAWNNPCASVRPPKQVRREVKVPAEDIVLTLLEKSKDTPYQAAFHLLAYTGMRRGEACGLTWQDVDLERGVISVNRAAARAKGKGVIMLPPKSERGRRTITIDPYTVEVLRQHRGASLVRQAEFGDVYRDQGYVFSNLLGEPLDPFVLTNAWRRLCARMGVNGVRLHDLRHFHATMLFRDGINPKVVQERLGHSTISVTLDVYSHVVPGLQEHAAETFANSMRRARANMES